MLIQLNFVQSFLRHSSEKDFIQRLTHEKWKEILLEDKDWTIYKGVKVKLFARDIGYGVVEVSKYETSKNKGRIFGGLKMKDKLEEEEKLYIKCPFCKDQDFDLMGLKYHLLEGYCEVFSHTEEIS